MHGDSVTEADVRSLAETYGFNLNLLRDVLDKDELARIEMVDGGLYVFVRTARRDKRGLVITTPVLLAVKGSVFINVSMAAPENHRLVTPKSLVAQVMDARGLLLGTFAAVVDEYEGFMRHTEKYVYDAEQRLRTHEVTNDDFIHFVTVENNLNEYQTHLSGMQSVAERLLEEMPGQDDREAIEDILLYIKQLLVAISSQRQSVTSIRNTFGMIANNALNQRIKALTVLMALIALPGVFFGMYGMNVALPFQHQPWAYGVITGAGIAVTLLVFGYAKKRGIF